MGLKDTHRQGLEASDRKLLTAEGNRDTSGLKSWAVTESMQGPPPPQSPVHPFGRTWESTLPGPTPPTRGRGACVRKARALTFE